jgi:hypothetical protein
MNLSDNPFTNLTQNWEFIAAAAAVVILFVIMVLFFLFGRTRRANRLDNVLGMTIDDVGALQQKGLLTPEETAKVRQALARQFTRALADKGQHPGEAALLGDPEVQRLEEIARRKAAARAAGLSTEPDSVGDRAGPPGPAPTQQAVPSIGDDDVPLPPDVLSMVQLGLITPEELERIKERIRAKRGASGV